MIVRVPASSANLGPGFDTLGLALGLHLELGFEAPGADAVASRPTGPTDRPADEGHPGVRAFRQLGGKGPVWIRSRIPMGRGLGFSGSARVAGLVAALAQARGPGFTPLDEAEQLLHVATALEWGVRVLDKQVVVHAEGDRPEPAKADIFPAYDDDGGLLLVLTPR